MRYFVVAAAALLAVACGGGEKSQPAAEPQAVSEATADVAIVGVDDLAERYVKLALALGQIDENYVDAYLGPAEWAELAKAQKPEIAALEAEADSILETLDVLDRDGTTPRLNALRRNLIAAKTRMRIARGEKIPFNEEARLIYGVTPPDYAAPAFDEAVADLERLAPGDGDLAARIEAFRQSLEIPAEKREAVMDAAIAECRKRTLAHYDLPQGERFKLEFVTGKPWSGYNWYQGDYESLIQVNTDLPVIIDRAVGLGCHEGYPGHHVWNVIVERDLRRGEGWIEFAIYPLFSPQGLLGEGSANYGVDLAFPGDEKLTFEREVLYPLAGLDPAKAETLDAINKAKRKLDHAGVWVARDYLDGNITREEAISRLVKYDLASEKRAAQRIDFFDTYRSYIINYSIGRDLVEDYIRRETAKGADPWDAFLALLRNPDAVSALAPQ